MEWFDNACLLPTQEHKTQKMGLGFFLVNGKDGGGVGVLFIEGGFERFVRNGVFC